MKPRLVTPWAAALEEIKYGCYFISVGVLVGIGIRASEWLIPKPEMRVLICQAGAANKAEACQRLDEMLKAKTP